MPPAGHVKAPDQGWRSLLPGNKDWEVGRKGRTWALEGQEGYNPTALPSEPSPPLPGDTHTSGTSASLWPHWALYALTEGTVTRVVVQIQPQPTSWQTNSQLQNSVRLSLLPCSLIPVTYVSGIWAMCLAVLIKYIYAFPSSAEAEGIFSVCQSCSNFCLN